MAPGEITQLLRAWRDGDERALDQLIPLVYAELRRLAHSYMRRERPEHTLETTGLVHEAYLRLARSPLDLNDRTHFFAVCAQLMRRVLVDYWRARRNLKRGGGVKLISLTDAPEIGRDGLVDLVALDEALSSLASVDPRKCQVVELRFFGGLTIEEIAEVLKVAPDTIKRDWTFAKSWLRRELDPERPHGS